MKIKLWVSRLKKAWEVTRYYFSSDGFHEQKYITGWSKHGLFEIRGEGWDGWLGPRAKWQGKPFVIWISPKYDLYDHVWEWVEALVYILSGQYMIDECREADQELLRYAL